MLSEQVFVFSNSNQQNSVVLVLLTFLVDNFLSSSLFQGVLGVNSRDLRSHFRDKTQSQVSDLFEVSFRPEPPLTADLNLLSVS